MIIHTHLLVKLTGPKYSEHSQPKTGQEEWSFCTNCSTIFYFCDSVYCKQHIASNILQATCTFLTLYSTRNGII